MMRGAEKPTPECTVECLRGGVQSPGLNPKPNESDPRDGEIRGGVKRLEEQPLGVRQIAAPRRGPRLVEKQPPAPARNRLQSPSGAVCLSGPPDELVGQAQTAETLDVVRIECDRALPMGDGVHVLLKYSFRVFSCTSQIRFQAKSERADWRRAASRFAPKGLV